MEDVDTTQFDRQLVNAAFALAAEVGWPRLRVAEAARQGGLRLDVARARFPGKAAILMRFGRLADQAALAAANDATLAGGSARDRLFDLFMQRLEFLQAHRAGVLALLRTLPTDPPLALLLAAASRRSMGWLLEGAGIDTTGLAGALRLSGAMAVWLWTVRAWERDTSDDLATTMSALDRALTRAEQAAGWLRRGASPAPTEAPPTMDDLPIVLPEHPPDAAEAVPPAL